MRAGKRRHRGGAPPAAATTGRPRASWCARLGKRLRAAGGAVRVAGQDGLRALAKAHIGAVEALRQAEARAQSAALLAGRRRRRRPPSSSPACSTPTMAAPDMRGGRLSRVLPQPRRPRRRVRPAGADASAHLHLGALRVAPAAARRRDPGLAQRGHLAAGRRSRARGSTGRCGRRWACRRRRSASAMPRTSSPRCSASSRVYLTRAAKIDGVPTVPSRWLLRLQALLAGVGPRRAARRSAVARLGAGAQCAGRARRDPCVRPSRGPRSALRPRQLSVTDHRELDRQPVRHLRRAHPGARAAAARWVASPTRRCAARSCTTRSAASRSASRTGCPRTSAPSSSPCAEAALAELTGSPRVAAFWAPRFARFAAWFADTERARRAGVAANARRGGGRHRAGRARRSLHAHGAGRPHRRRRRRPRHHRLQDGGNVKDAGRPGRAGRGAAAAAGGGDRRRPAASPGCLRATSSALRYISASGGEPPGQECPLDTDDVAALARERARRARAADRRLRRRGHALSRAAAGPLQLPLRRLRPPRPRGGVVGRDRCEEDVERWALFELSGERSRARERQRDGASRGDAAQPGGRRRSVRLRLGERQRRHRQDARADHARAAPAARRHAARAHPGADLHQGRRRGDVQARVRPARRVGDGRRGEPEAQARRAARPRADARQRCSGRGSCSPSPSRRPAASRCRPSTPSASGCCSGFRSRPACRRASSSSTSTSATPC